jgi:hypothetical protein
MSITGRVSQLRLAQAKDDAPTKGQQLTFNLRVTTKLPMADTFS